MKEEIPVSFYLSSVLRIEVDAMSIECKGGEAE
jgi:hypothetical protein